MTKRRLETDIDDLSDEILGELDPSDRVGLMLRARAGGRDAWIDRLRQTCPQHTYETYDVEYTNRMQLATVWGCNARYGLQIALDRYRYAMLRRNRDTLLWIVADEEMKPLVEEVIDDSETTITPIEWVVRLARDYYGYEMFAEEVLGISLAEWLGGLPGEVDVVESATEVLEMYESSFDIGAAGEADAEEVIEVAADAEALYETLREQWQNIDDPRFVAD